eukprot:Rhum_TRINITY_DN15392_c2_g9::Rhum_TRINITY_DN15392_c2_g9_i7::g.152097::m.152097
MVAVAIRNIETTTFVDQESTHFDGFCTDSLVKGCPAVNIFNIERVAPLDQKLAKRDVGVAASNVERGGVVGFLQSTVHLGIKVQLTHTHVTLFCRITKALQVHTATLLSQDGRSPHCRRHRHGDNAALAKRAHSLVVRRTPSDLQ